VHSCTALGSMAKSPRYVTFNLVLKDGHVVAQSMSRTVSLVGKCYPGYAVCVSIYNLQDMWANYAPRCMLYSKQRVTCGLVARTLLKLQAAYSSIARA
jgi:hypothetical protein